MADYYSIMRRAVAVPGSENESRRRAIYDRARRILESELRARQQPASAAEVSAVRSKLEAAIERIELEFAEEAARSLGGRGGVAPEPRVAAGDRYARADDGGEPYAADSADEPWTESWAEADGRPRRSFARPVLWAALAVILAAVSAGGYAFWTNSTHQPAPAASRSEAALHSPALRPGRRAPIADTAAAADLAPGVDGGSTDADLPFVYKRQRVYFRTPLPPGTVVVDKDQNFLYLVQPKSVAVRYGIGLGARCADLAGLQRVTAKTEWPEWQPTPDQVARRLARAGLVPGGPGNPLGARALDLDDGSARIHGTNAPKTIGNAVALGCIRLVNDDVVDLYNHVPVGTRVVMR